MPKHSVCDLEGIFGDLNVLDYESCSKFTTNRHQSNSLKSRFHMTARLAAHTLNPSTKKAASHGGKGDGQGGSRAHVVLCWSRDLGLGWEPANCAAPNRPLPLRIQAPIKDCAASFRLSTLSLD